MHIMVKDRTQVMFAWIKCTYIHCKFHNMATSRDVLERCIQDIGHWMSANHLKLNPDKTELLWTRTRHSLSRLTDGGPRLVLGDEVIDTLSSACLLGVTFTPDLCLEKHVSIIRGKCFSSYVSCDMYDVHLTWKWHWRSYIRSSPAGLTIATLLWREHPKRLTEKLQRVMNATARILTQTKKYERGLTPDTPWWAALARCFREHPVQALRWRLQVPAWHSSKIHDGSMPTCFCNRGIQPPVFSGERTTWCTTSKAQHGTHCPTTLKTAAWLLSCLNDY